jgi:hypothetical protein
MSTLSSYSETRHLLSLSRPPSVLAHDDDASSLAAASETSRAQDFACATSAPTKSTVEPNIPRSHSEPQTPSQGPDAVSPVLRSRGFRGYESEDAYLAALIEFCNEKGYFETDTQITGFYGKKTVQDYVVEGSGWRAESREERRRRKEAKAQRRSTLRSIGEIARERDPGGVERSENEGMGRRLSRGLNAVLRRRGTVA